MHTGGKQKNLAAPEEECSEPVTLDFIVKEYLRSQHRLCESPVAVLPEFSLTERHRCPRQLSHTHAHSVASLMGTGSGGQRSNALRLIRARQHCVRAPFQAGGRAQRLLERLGFSHFSVERYALFYSCVSFFFRIGVVCMCV
jgi:hypothetical protein